MTDAGKPDYYEILQVSANAEPDTIHRIYRLLAQRFHPDNQESGDADRFQQIHESYTILSDPERRAKYDVSYHQLRQERWRLVSNGANSENDFEFEQIGRLTLLEALYTRRRMEPTTPSLMTSDLETLIGRPREHLDFTIWYLQQKKYVTRDDQARLQITADGVEHLEQNYRSNLQRRRLGAPKDN
jgi:curved DNA-binding protein